MSLTINRLKEVSWDCSSPSLRVLPNIPEHDLHKWEVDRASCNIRRTRKLSFLSLNALYCISSIRHRCYYIFCCSFLCSYCSRVATIQELHSFLWTVHRHQQRLDMYDWYSDECKMLSIVCAASKVYCQLWNTSLTTRIAQAVVHWLSSEIIYKPVRVPCILSQLLFKGGVYLKRCSSTNGAEFNSQA